MACADKCLEDALRRRRQAVQQQRYGTRLGGSSRKPSASLTARPARAARMPTCASSIGMTSDAGSRSKPASTAGTASLPSR
eukprot:scaffold16829_cov69-Phaeocystis_antarctica.AAC.3